MTKRDICLVSSSPLASNPRLVKEADALSAEGYAVTVVSNDRVVWLRDFNTLIADNAQWEHRPLQSFGAVRAAAMSAKRKAARPFAARDADTPAGSIDCWAHSKYAAALKQKAAEIPARLYIAHTLEALPAAAYAAKHWAGRYAFDAEDLHSEELPDSPKNVLERRLRRRIEDTWLPGCAYITAASPQIAEVYSRRYRRLVTSILNVFPLPETTKKPQFTKEKRLYWFSQTIGPGRGLEEVLSIMGAMKTPVHLFLQGTWAHGYRAHFTAQARQRGLGGRIHERGPCAPHVLLEAPSQYDVGLSVELNEPPHHAVCLGNKIFTYLGAGTPVILSDTPAQRWIAEQLDDAALVVNIKNAQSAAERIDVWLSEENLARAGRAARAAAEREFNWYREKTKLLELVQGVLRDPCAVC